MSDIFTCDCGVKTREPFRVHGRLMCTMCAEDVAPNIVAERARNNYRRYSNDRRMVQWNKLEK